MTRSLSIEYTDDILASVGLSESDFAVTAKFIVAQQLYSDGKLSAGQAAKLCDMDKVSFLHALARHGTPASNLRLDDLKTELEFARGH